MLDPIAPILDPPHPTAARPWGWVSLEYGERLSLLAFAASFLAVAAVAAWLEPDARGVGTHQQLGLAPCSAQALFHFPCPFCGMTTAFAHMADGNVLRAFQTQPAGALGFIAGATAAPVALICGALGRGPAAVRRAFRSRALLLAGAVVLALGWVYKIAVFS